MSDLNRGRLPPPILSASMPTDSAPQEGERERIARAFIAGENDLHNRSGFPTMVSGQGGLDHASRDRKERAYAYADDALLGAAPAERGGLKGATGGLIAEIDAALNQRGKHFVGGGAHILLYRAMLLLKKQEAELDAVEAHLARLAAAPREQEPGTLERLAASADTSTRLMRIRRVIEARIRNTTHWHGCEDDHWECELIALLDTLIADAALAEDYGHEQEPPAPGEARADGCIDCPPHGICEVCGCTAAPTGEAAQLADATRILLARLEEVHGRALWVEPPNRDLYAAAQDVHRLLRMDTQGDPSTSNPLP